MIWLELHYFAWKEQSLWQFCKLRVVMFNKLGEKEFLFCATCTLILISDPVTLSFMALHFTYAFFLLPTSSFGDLTVLNLVHWRLLWCCSNCICANAFADVCRNLCWKLLQDSFCIFHYSWLGVFFSLLFSQDASH